MRTITKTTTNINTEIHYYELKNRESVSCVDFGTGRQVGAAEVRSKSPTKTGDVMISALGVPERRGKPAIVG